MKIFLGKYLFCYLLIEQPEEWQIDRLRAGVYQTSPCHSCIQLAAEWTPPPPVKPQSDLERVSLPFSESECFTTLTGLLYFLFLFLCIIKVSTKKWSFNSVGVEVCVFMWRGLPPAEDWGQRQSNWNVVMTGMDFTHHSPATSRLTTQYALLFASGSNWDFYR